MPEPIGNSLIASIRIEKLFGLYNYRLPEIDQFSNATILYGDNGTGKSTLLRLVFHLLSAGDDRGHRTALYKTDFEFLEVVLDSGIRLTARRSAESDPPILKLEVVDENKILAIWEYLPNSLRK